MSQKPTERPMMSDPKIDPERMKQWGANILPVPSAECLKGKGPPPSSCSHKRITDTIKERGWKPLPSHLREDRIPTVSGEIAPAHSSTERK